MSTKNQNLQAVETERAAASVQFTDHDLYRLRQLRRFLDGLQMISQQSGSAVWEAAAIDWMLSPAVEEAERLVRDIEARFAEAPDTGGAA